MWNTARQKHRPRQDLGLQQTVVNQGDEQSLVDNPKFGHGPHHICNVLRVKIIQYPEQRECHNRWIWGSGHLHPRQRL